jgi:hypothetical protein
MLVMPTVLDHLQSGSRSAHLGAHYYICTQMGSNPIFLPTKDESSFRLLKEWSELFLKIEHRMSIMLFLLKWCYMLQKAVFQQLSQSSGFSYSLGNLQRISASQFKESAPFLTDRRLKTYICYTGKFMQ